ncbi:MAG: isoprenylcysteine carboxylmethyltransferase family protein [Candidatus Neomarinimicrobiota bacterium]
MIMDGFKWTKKEILLGTPMTILCIACFPVNPLVLTGILQTSFYPILFALGWAFWAFGMVLVMTPIIMFPRRGGVPKGKSFVHTTHVVDSGPYSLVRHPQYLGGILAIFITTLLFYPNWLFAILGTIGAVAVYMSCKEEEVRLVQQFGDEYLRYMERVPRMNIVVGILRLLRASS